MNLWGGRFTKPTNQLVYDFNASIKFDKTFASQDIKGSIGHVKMLTKQEILTQEEGQLIEKTLKEINDLVATLPSDTSNIMFLNKTNTNIRLFKRYLCSFCITKSVLISDYAEIKKFPRLSIYNLSL